MVLNFFGKFPYLEETLSPYLSTNDAVEGLLIREIPEALYRFTNFE